jgi:hypothetical protein
MNLRTLVFLVIGACALPCWASAGGKGAAKASEDSGVSSATVEVAAEIPVEKTTAAVAPAPELPAEGSLFRTLFGAKVTKWIDVGSTMEMDLLETNHLSQAERAEGSQCSMFPGQLNDCGFGFGYIDTWITKNPASNIYAGPGPFPFPAPKKVDWGYRTDILYGRNPFVNTMHGWSQGWGINNPGVSPVYRQNYLGQTTAEVFLYLPVLHGTMISAGMLPDYASSETPPAMRPSPVKFFTNTYAMGMQQPHSYIGVLVDNNIYRSKHGMVATQLGIGNGFDSVTSPNGHRSFTGTVFYRTNNMATTVAYAFWVQDGAMSQSKFGQHYQQNYNFYQVVSPSYQAYQGHSITVSHNFGPKWESRIEGMFGSQAGDGKAETIVFSAVPGPPAPGTPGFKGANWHGVNGDLTYKYKKNLWYSLRAEQFSDPDGYSPFFYGAKTNVNHLDLGMHYDLNKYTQFRPGVRYDWQSNYRRDQPYAFYGGKSSSQWAGLMDVVFFF